LTHKQIFFSIWLVIVGIFVALMVAYYRRNTRSNFRRPGDAPAPKIYIDAKRLGNNAGGNLSVQKDDKRKNS